jgi:hypothetical protein
MDGLIVLGMLVFLLVGMLGFLASAVGGVGGLLVTWRILRAFARGAWFLLRGVSAVIRYAAGDRPRRLNARALRGSGRDVRWNAGRPSEDP